MTVNKQDISAFQRDGFLVRRQLISPGRVAQLVEAIDHALNPALAPVEFEADGHYHGGAAALLAPGGQTPRRLLHAYGRDRLFQSVGQDPDVVATLKALMATDSLRLSQNHHNLSLIHI